MGRDNITPKVPLCARWKEKLRARLDQSLLLHKPFGVQSWTSVTGGFDD
jgi:hypothetical protein